MTDTCNRRRMRLLGMPVACLLASFPLSACAEIEVGAEVAKRIARANDTGSLTSIATDPAVPSPAPAPQETQLAQASTGNGNTLAISPFLQPAPEIFEATGLAIWDGKRTLQGIWVAHPLATSARRVRIFNQNNGQAVDGALFKRDTADNGASILISSEAAQLLGMGVGSPAELRIVAVSPVQRSTEPQQTDQTATTDETDQPTAENMPAVANAQPNATAQAEVSTPTPAAKPALPVPQIQPAQPAVQPDPEPEPAPTPAPTVARAEPAQTPAATKPAATSPLKLPYIQAGIFGVQANATKLIRRIKGKDIPAEGRTLRSKGRKLTRVLAGPFQTTAERNAALRAIRKMGLKDAAPVRR